MNAALSSSSLLVVYSLSFYDTSYFFLPLDLSSLCLCFIPCYVMPIWILILYKWVRWALFTITHHTKYNIYHARIQSATFANSYISCYSARIRSILACTCPDSPHSPLASTLRTLCSYSRAISISIPISVFALSTVVACSLSLMLAMANSCLLSSYWLSTLYC